MHQVQIFQYPEGTFTLPRKTHPQSLNSNIYEQKQLEVQTLDKYHQLGDGDTQRTSSAVSDAELTVR